MKQPPKRTKHEPTLLRDSSPMVKQPAAEAKRGNRVLLRLQVKHSATAVLTLR